MWEKMSIHRAPESWTRHRLFPEPWISLFFTGLLAAGAGLRLVYCFLPPPTTTDLIRNLGYGQAFPSYGLLLYDMTPSDLAPSPCQFFWENHHYSYPPAALMLFAAIAALSTALPVAKLILTLFDALGAWAMWKYTGDRWIALLYWLNPISVWFSSREGQFEGFVVLWAVMALLALKHKKAYALGLLGIAVQTKFFPALLLPYFLQNLPWREPRRLAASLAWGVCSLAPSFLAYLFGGYPQHLLEANYVPDINPISWFIGDPTRYGDFPAGLIYAHMAVSLAFEFYCLYGMRRTRTVWPWLTPFLFVFLVHTSTLAQFWYLIFLPALCLLVEEKNPRRILFLGCAGMGPLSLCSIFLGPTGYRNPPDVMIVINKIFWGF